MPAWYSPSDTCTTSTGACGTITFYGGTASTTSATSTTSGATRYYVRRYYVGSSTATSDYFPMYPAGRSPAEQAAKVRAHKPEAQSRALQLLLEHLTPAQKKTFMENRWFVVEGGKSGQKYRIREREDLVANIDVLDGMKIKHKLCGHCDPEQVPLYDHLLAQKVMLEIDEERFLKLANRHAA